MNLSLSLTKVFATHGSYGIYKAGQQRLQHCKIIPASYSRLKVKGSVSIERTDAALLWATGSEPAVLELPPFQTLHWSAVASLIIACGDHQLLVGRKLLLGDCELVSKHHPLQHRQDTSSKGSTGRMLAT